MPIDPTTNDILGTGELRIPAGVKATTPEQQQMYRAAVEFERFFVSHLMQQMNAATKALKGGDDESADPAASQYEGMISDQMTQSVLDGGGLGLASVLYEQISGQVDRPASASPASSTAVGGTSS